jgi:hypothetical protein
MLNRKIINQTLFIVALLQCQNLFATNNFQTPNPDQNAFLSEFSNCIKNGKPTGSMRIRNEYDHNDGKPKDADAATISSKLGYELSCGKAKIVVEGQGNIGLTNDYNTTLNNKPQYATIPDPNGANLHQGYLEYNPVNWFNFKIGRQEIKWDDESLIGSAAWRNLSTSYDAIRSILTPDFFVKDLSLETSFLNNKKDSKNLDIGMKTTLARMTYSGITNQNFSAHTILINYDSSPLNLNKTSTATWGFVYNGHAKYLII